MARPSKYRVVKEKFWDEVYYSIYAVLYDKDSKTILSSIKATGCCESTLEELKKDYEEMGKAFDEPTLDYHRE